MCTWHICSRNQALQTKKISAVRWDPVRHWHEYMNENVKITRTNPIKAANRSENIQTCLSHHWQKSFVKKHAGMRIKKKVIDFFKKKTKLMQSSELTSRPTKHAEKTLSKAWCLVTACCKHTYIPWQTAATLLGVHMFVSHINPQLFLKSYKLIKKFSWKRKTEHDRTWKFYYNVKLWN